MSHQSNLYADDFRGSRIKSEEIDKENELCKCGHMRAKHPHNKDCIFLVDPTKAKYCKCYAYRSEKL